MPMKKKYTLHDLRKLTRSQLVVICNNRAIKINEGASEENIISLILEDQFNLISKQNSKEKTKLQTEPKPETELQTEPEARTEPEPEPKAEAEPEPETELRAKDGNDRIWFKVMAGSQSHEKDAAFASINGEAILVKRNQWVKLKRKYVNVFANAIETEIYIENDEAKIRQVPRFNFITRSLDEGIPSNERR